MKFVDHHWRLIGTAIGFAVFGVAGLITGLVLFPLMFLFIRDRQVRKVKARRFIGTSFGLFIGMMKSLGVIDHDIGGRENISDGQNILIIANHPTLIDVVILISMFPQANCVIKEAVTRNLFMRSVVSAADYISNYEPEELLLTCTAYLKSGGSLMLFPEGTRTTLDQRIEFKPGAAAVAARSEVDILPIAIQCRPIFLHKEVPWHYVPPSCPMFTIRVLPPVAISDLVPDADNERHIRHDLNNSLLELIQCELDVIAGDGSVNGRPPCV